MTGTGSSRGDPPGRPYELKNLNHRGRRAHRDKKDKRLKARGQGNKQPLSQPFPKGQNSQWAFRKGPLRSPLPLRSSSCLSQYLGYKKSDFFPKKEKGTTNRREPGGRREDEIFIKGFMVLVFLKKMLCGLWFLSPFWEKSRFFCIPNTEKDKRMNEEEAESAEVLF